MIITNKDNAIIDLTYKFNKVKLNNIKVTQQEIKKANLLNDKDLKKPSILQKAILKNFTNFN